MNMGLDVKGIEYTWMLEVTLMVKKSKPIEERLL